MTEQKSSDKIILALDQSTSATGYCVFVNNRMVESGVLTPSIETSDEANNFYDRINDMGYQISQLVDRIKPTVVIMEDIQFQRNYGTYKRLANLQGVIFTYLYLHQTPFLLVEVTKWKSYLGVLSKGRANQKRDTKLRVREIYNLEADEITEDEADAIGIGHWAINNVVITQLEESED